jgi:hypothetical protein
LVLVVLVVLLVLLVDQMEATLYLVQSLQLVVAVVEVELLV